MCKLTRDSGNSAPFPRRSRPFPGEGRRKKSSVSKGFSRFTKKSPREKRRGLGPSPQEEKESARGGPPLYYNSIGAGRPGRGGAWGGFSQRLGGQGGEERGKSPGKPWGAVRRRKTKGPRPLPQPLCQRISSLKKPEKSASRQREVPVPLTRPSIMPVYKLVKGNL